MIIEFNVMQCQLKNLADITFTNPAFMLSDSLEHYLWRDAFSLQCAIFFLYVRVKITILLQEWNGLESLEFFF